MPNKRACHTPSRRLVPVAEVPDAIVSSAWCRWHVILCQSKFVPGRRGTASHGFKPAPGIEAVRSRVVASWHGALRSTPSWPGAFLFALPHIAHHILSIPVLPAYLLAPSLLPAHTMACGHRYMASKNCIIGTDIFLRMKSAHASFSSSQSHCCVTR